MILDIYKKKANIAYFEEAVENGYRMSIALEYDAATIITECGCTKQMQRSCS